MSTTEPETDQQDVPIARAVNSRPRLRPPVMTFGLIAANLLMAFVQWAAAGFPVDRFPEYSNDFADWILGAKVPSLVESGEYWRLVTANFLHGNLFHLLLNMVSLLVLGRLVELYYGRLRTLVIFTLSCVAGAVFSYKFTTSISLGASTGVMGLLTAILLHNWKYRRYLPSRINAIYPALLAMLLLQFVLDTFNPSTDTLGHLGGAIGGLFVAALLESRIAGPRQSERDWLPLPTAVATAVLLLTYGAWGIASTLPSQLPLLRAGQSGNPTEQLAALQRVVSERPRFVEAKLAVARLQVVQRNPVGARQAFYDAVAQVPSLRDSAIGRDLRNAIGVLFEQQALAAYEGGNWEAAVRLHQEVFNLEPTRPEILAQAHNGYAWTLADKLNRNLDEAEKHAKEGLKHAPGNPAITDTLAWVYYRQKRYPEALKVQLEAVDLMKNGPARPVERAEYFYHLGAIYEALDRKSDAQSNYSQALAFDPRFLPAAEGLRRLSPDSGSTPVAPRAPSPAPMFPLPRRSPAGERGLI